MKINSKIIVILFLLAVSVISIIWIQELTGKIITKYQCQNGQTVVSSNLCPKVEEKALLNSQVFNWDTNHYNDSEVFFDINLVNYGNAEARNIVIKCNLYESDIHGRRLYSYPNFTTTSRFAVIAPISYKSVGMVSAKENLNNSKNYTALCLPISCDNCEILPKRIPDMSYFFD